MFKQDVGIGFERIVKFILELDFTEEEIATIFEASKTISDHPIFKEIVNKIVININNTASLTEKSDIGIYLTKIIENISLSDLDKLFPIYFNNEELSNLIPNIILEKVL